MPLREYIETYFTSQAEFARSQGKLPQQVTKWLAMDCIVVNGKLYSYRADINEELVALAGI